RRDGGERRGSETGDAAVLEARARKTGRGSAGGGAETRVAGAGDGACVAAIDPDLPARSVLPDVVRTLGAQFLRELRHGAVDHRVRHGPMGGEGAFRGRQHGDTALSDATGAAHRAERAARGRPAHPAITCAAPSANTARSATSASPR